jgi:hypothetical protein
MWPHYCRPGRSGWGGTMRIARDTSSFRRLLSPRMVAAASFCMLHFPGVAMAHVRVPNYTHLGRLMDAGDQGARTATHLRRPGATEQGAAKVRPGCGVRLMGQFVRHSDRRMIFAPVFLGLHRPPAHEVETASARSVAFRVLREQPAGRIATPRSRLHVEARRLRQPNEAPFLQFLESQAGSRLRDVDAFGQAQRHVPAWPPHEGGNRDEAMDIQAPA